MTMMDCVNHVDSILKVVGEDILTNVGKISYQEMEAKVNNEYKQKNINTSRERLFSCNKSIRKKCCR